MSLQAPFPYFGGKRRAAPLIWKLLGDPGGYVEPFAGSAAALLARPAVTSRRVETLNDADGWLINAWRSIQLAPSEVARHAYGPVSEVDYHARLAWLQARRDEELVAWLEGDPEHHDPRAAGWWLYVLACGIGEPFGSGPWRVVDGHFRKAGNAGQGVNRELPHLGNAGRGPLGAYMRALCDRLARVRITCGDWRRVVTPSAVRAKVNGDGHIGLLLDPPYSIGYDHYSATSSSVAAEVREWCATAPGDLRIVICGYDDEHDALRDRGWTVHQSKSGRGAGYSVRPDNGRRERIWASPACLTEPDLFTVDGEAG